jgi:hypothetical protein
MQFDVTPNTRYVFVGGSHAGRLASALRESGAEVADASVPGWKISEESVETSIELLKEILEEHWAGETVILYQLFDNTTFFSIGTDGSATLPRKSWTDGLYHVEGALGLLDRDAFKVYFSTAVPLLRAGGMCKKLIISPMMRYAAENCCANPAHCTNRGGNLNAVLSEGLATIETWIDDQCYLKRIRNFHVINPNLLITPDGISKSDTKTFKMYWKAGPVHMTALGYEKLSKSIVEELASAEFKRAESNTASAGAQPKQPPRGRGHGRRAGRGRIDLTTQRQKWITNSDTVAHRNYDTPNRGQERGRQGHWRGRGHFSRGGGYYGKKYSPYTKK